MLALVGAPVLILTAVASRDVWRIVAVSIYAATLVILYGASTLYHSTRSAEWKEICQRIDHAAIYLLIAGTYTPFTLISLRGAWGWSLFSVVWALAIFGVILKSAFGARLPSLSTWVYLLMGWMIVIALRPLSAACCASRDAMARTRWTALHGRRRVLRLGAHSVQSRRLASVRAGRELAYILPPVLGYALPPQHSG